MVDKLFVAMKAFIEYDGKILILKESSKNPDGTQADKFDIVGGRIELGERFDEALLREVQEETGLDVALERPFTVGEWRPKVRGEEWQIVATMFAATAKNNQVVLSQDHSGYEWINPKDYKNYPLMENLIPAFEEYLKLKN